MLHLKCMQKYHTFYSRRCCLVIYKTWVDLTKLDPEFLQRPHIHSRSCYCVCHASLFQWISPGQELNVFSTMADWQRGQMFCFSAVCPLTSPKSAPISALTCQSTALCTASPPLCLSPGTTTLTVCSTVVCSLPITVFLSIYLRF